MIKNSTNKTDFIFALHNLPGYSLNEIIVKNNIFTASVNSMIIDLYGKESHAAEPEQGINPALLFLRYYVNVFQWIIINLNRMI
ncbi:MAG: hypothetical protein R2942_18630 [Ignavibacteria bacterium]